VSKAAQGLVRLPVWRARVVLIVPRRRLRRARGARGLAAGDGDRFPAGEGRGALRARDGDRGDARRVLDRNGEALAVSTPVKSVWAIPGDVDAGDRERRKLASLLAMQKIELDKRLGDGSRDFVYLKRQIAPETAAAVQQLGLKGIHEHVEYGAITRAVK
jgi:cell division protein FtsI (penicillin-binding protein 3)